jgi:hypothetical protein
MRHPNLRSRDGFALPFALLAMVVIGAIVTGGFYVASQEGRVSMSSDLGAQGLSVAEYGLETAFGTWTNSTLWNATDPVLGGVFSNGGRELGTYQLTVLPVANNLYMIESQGQVTRGPRTATRRVSGFVRTTNFSMPYQSAMTVYGQLEASGNSTITGVDRCGGDGTVPGIYAKDEESITGLVQGSGPNARERIIGDPEPVVEDETMTTETLSDYGGIDLVGLIANANRIYAGNPAHPQGMAPATTTNEWGQTVCDKTVDLNWGDPLEANQPCSHYYPIIYSPGNMKLDVGKGQGILIVGGDLLIDGNIEFSGIVIVLGSFTMMGTGSKINGTVIVMGDGSVETLNIQEGNAQVQYDSCVINEALNSNLRIRPLASRSWVMDTPPLSSLGG